MKNVIYLFLIALLVYACGGKSSNPNELKLAELEENFTKLGNSIQAIKSTNTDVAFLEKAYADLGKQLQDLKKDFAKKMGKSVDEGIEVAVKSIESSQFYHAIEVSGNIDSDQNINLSAQMGGNIMRVLVKVGDRVSAGQLLAETDASALQQGVAEVKVQYDFAKNIFEKQKRLWDQGIGSEIQYLSAKNNVESLEKRMATMNQQIAMSKIKSPINGTVDEVNIKEGQLAIPGMPIIKVVNTTNLKAKADVAESYIKDIKKGAKVIVNVPDANKRFETKLSYSGQVVNPLNRTFNVEINLDKKSGEGLYPDMLAKIEIIDYNITNAIVLPTNVIQKDATGTYVLVVDKNEKGKSIAKKQVVKTGKTYNGKIEILEGLKPNDSYISTGFIGLNDQDEIKIIK